MTSAEHERRFKATWTSEGTRCLLGEGSFAKVYLEYDKQEGVFVANKTPRKRKGRSSFLPEVALMCKIAGKCRHLIAMLGVVVPSHDATQEVLGVLMECCDSNVDEHWRERMGLVDRAFQTRCLKHVLQGLRHLHTCSVVHLDLGPKNVLLLWHAWTGLCAKIADFGQSVCLEPGCRIQQKGKVTTWPYRAPEVALGLQYGREADVWALGVLARELATGRRVYELLEFKGSDVAYVRLLAGRLTNDTWPDVERAPCWEPVPSTFAMDEDTLTRHAQANEVGVEFARTLLHAAPEKRPTVEQAMRHPYMVYGGVAKRLSYKSACTPRCGRSVLAFAPERRQRPGGGAAATLTRQQRPPRQGAGSSGLAPSQAASSGLAPSQAAGAVEVSGTSLAAGGAHPQASVRGLALSEIVDSLARSQVADVLPQSAAARATRLCCCKGGCRTSTGLCGASWGRKEQGCQQALSDTEEARQSEYCRNCRCGWCGHGKWKSRACCRCQFRLVKPQMMAVRQYAPTLKWMVPVDLVAFVSYATLADPVQAVIMAQLWCPVCVYFAFKFRGDVALVMAALLKQLAQWRQQNSSEWRWHQRYMSHVHEGGAQLSFGPEALAKRLGLIVDGVTSSSKGASLIFTASGTEYTLNEKVCAKSVKAMAARLSSKWQSRGAPAVSRGAATSRRGAATSRQGAASSSGALAVPKGADIVLGLVMEQYKIIADEVLELGKAESFTRMGKDSDYIRPHVCRKLFLLLLHNNDCKLSSVPWRKLTFDQVQSLGPDMKGNLAQAPSHWHHKGMSVFTNLDGDSGASVPLIMHGCWSCLFGYAVSSTYCRGMGALAEGFICEGRANEFERCACRLFAQTGVPPTPVEVLRDILVDRNRNDERQREWPLGDAPAVFGEVVPGLPNFSHPPPGSD